MTSAPQKPSSITNYGAVQNLQDNFPRKNPATEWSAAEINQLRNDVTACASVIPVCRFVIAGVSSGNPALTPTATWSGPPNPQTPGLYSSWFSSPTSISFVRNSTGNITCTLPATCQDWQGNAGITVNITDVHVNVLGGGSNDYLNKSLVTIVSSAVFTVVLYGNSGLSDFVGQPITFTVY